MNITATQPGIRDKLLQRMTDARSATDELFQMVRAEALFDRPIPERHRIAFYIGHLEAFDWNLIAGQALGMGSLHKELDRLFAFGIDPVNGGLPDDKPSDWPRIAEIDVYNFRVREGIDDILKSDLLTSEREWKYSQEVILNVAIEHRLMHAETLAYMLHQLSLEQKIVPRRYQPFGRARPGRRRPSRPSGPEARPLFRDPVVRQDLPPASLRLQ